MPCRATQDGLVMVEIYDKTWSTGERNGKSLQYSCLENPMDSMKRQKDRTLKDELPGSLKVKEKSKKVGLKLNIQKTKIMVSGPSPVDHILSELSAMTCPSWVALHDMAHSFIELDKAVVHVISLVSFPHIHSLPTGNFHKALILIHQRADRMKTTVTEN